MKSQKFFIAGGIVGLIIMMMPVQVQAQDDQESNLSVGVDFYTNYIWRGSKLGTGPSLQPSVTYTNGGLTVGVWGAFDAFGYAEADPYISFEFPFGLSLGVTDYYYPDLELFDVSTASGSHALELNAGFAVGGLSLGANYIVNEAGGAASAGGDMYFQAAYAFDCMELWVGAGDGWHTAEGNFALCNIGIGTSKEISIGEKFSIPVTGQVIFNPDKEQLFVVAGFSF